MPTQCEEISSLLPGVVDGSAVLDPRSSEHVSSCLRCQADVAQYRRLLRTLHQLRHEPVAVPADLPGLVLAGLDHPVNPWARRAAYAGAFAATAAGATGAILLMASRNRRLRLAG